MITLNASGGSITFTFSGNSTYLNDGTITVPVNSLALIVDESDMATFRKAASNDIFVSANIAEFGMTKDELMAWYKANMVSSGGGGGGVTPEEVEEMIDEAISGITVSGVTEEELNEAIASAKTEIEAEIPTVPTSNTAFTNDAGYVTSGYVDSSVSGYADSCLYDDNAKAVKFYHGGTGGTEVYSFDASPFLVDGMIDDVRIETISGVTYLVIDFNTASGKEDIQIPLTDIFDPSNYYDKTEIDAIVSGKADTTAVTEEISAAVSGKTNESDFSAHTANTIIHVTSSQTAYWDAKSNFSGSYNDLTDKPTIPTVPTSNTAFTNDAGYITEDALSGYAKSSTVTDEISSAVSGKADSSAVTEVSDALTAHTANTTVHVTSTEKDTWNAKSDFSGSYNDLTDKPTIPTVPTSNTAFTNDAGYITSGEAQTQIDNSISGKVDTTTYTAYTAATDVALASKQTTLTAGTGISIVDNVISATGGGGITSGEVQTMIDESISGKVETSAITSAVTSASTDSEIPTAKAVFDAIPTGGTGGGKAISAGTNISITTGETADTINCTLPITASTSPRSTDIFIGNDIPVGATNYSRLIVGSGNKVQYNNTRTSSSILIATPGGNSSIYNIVKATYCIGIGGDNLEVGYDNINGYGSIAIGYGSKSLINKSLAIGYNTVASGTTQTNINNQLKIDSSNQVYIYNKDNTEMICLQDVISNILNRLTTIENNS